MTCSIPDCSKRPVTRGWCHMHYARWRKYGDPLFLLPKPTLEEAFWAKVSKGADCWEWVGARTGNGYGNFRSRSAHRVGYEMQVGPVPDGLDLDHLCRNRGCVNPAHLEPVTRKENSLRGNSPNVIQHHLGECRRGHKLEGDNVLWHSGKRKCRTCVRAQNAKTTERRRAERGAA